MSRSHRSQRTLGALVVLFAATTALAGCGGSEAAQNPSEGTDMSVGVSAEPIDDAPSATSTNSPTSAELLAEGMPAWSSLGSFLPQVPGVLEPTYGLPVITEDTKNYAWPTISPADLPSRSAPLNIDARKQLSAPLPGGYDATRCPTLGELVGPTARIDALLDMAAPRFFFAGEVTEASLWHEYPETFYDIAVLAPYAGTPTDTATPWYQFFRTNGDPLGMSGQPLGYGFALEPGKILLISGTEQNTQSANGFVDRLPYELADGWWEPMDPASLRFEYLIPQVDRFPAGCLRMPTA